MKLIFTMEATKQKRKAGMNEKDLILSAFRDYVLTEGKEPASVYHLGKLSGFSEEQFYGHFSSISRLSFEIWQQHLEIAATAVRNNPEYAAFSGRDKLLLFYFSLVQHLKKDRSFISWSAGDLKNPLQKSSLRKELSSWIKKYTQEILLDARNSGEVKDRGKLSDHYADAMMIQFWFILDFWLKDESRDFVDTDALIEKTLGLSFDLLGEGPLEKALDLGRFLLGRVMPQHS